MVDVGWWGRVCWAVVVWWCGGLVVWWFGGVVVWWFGGVVWWFGGVVVAVGGLDVSRMRGSLTCDTPPPHLFILALP